jgi:hypothetical protein
LGFEIRIWFACRKALKAYGPFQIFGKQLHGGAYSGGLTRFMDDGRIELDNNTVERSIRPIALNRKNALFAGSDGGAEHWATIASLIETCKLNDIDPLSSTFSPRSSTAIPTATSINYCRGPTQSRTSSRGLKTTLTPKQWYWPN